MAPAITLVELLRNTTNDVGTATAFDVTSEFLGSVTPTNDGTTVTYTGASVGRTGLTPGTAYYYWLSVTDQAGLNTVQYLGTITTASSYIPLITAAVDFERTSPGVHMDLNVASTTETEGTISFWFKRQSDVTMGLFATQSTGAWDSMTGASVIIGAESGVRYAFSRIGGTTVRTTTTANMDWNHVLWSWNSSSGQFHLNDVAVSMTGAVPKGPYLKNTIVVGPMYTNGTFDHSIDACMAEVYYGSEYLDLGVEANRRKFISATCSPVSLGADGSLPTGNQPDVYMSGAAANWNAGKNFGSAGDFTVTGTLTECATSPELWPIDIGAAVDFDGTNDYLSGTGTVNHASKVGTISVWARFDATGAAYELFSSYAAAMVEIRKNSDDSITVHGRVMGSSSNILLLTTNNTYIANTWYHIIVSWDLASTTASMYVNDVSQALTTTLVNNNITWIEADYTVGARPGGGVKLNGCMAELYATREYIDLSVEANRRKFISASGAPVSLGADGSLPTGNQPDIYLSGAAANWDAGKNFGSAPDFTVTGALTDCASLPGISSQVIPAWVDMNTTNVGSIAGGFGNLNVHSGERQYDDAVVNTPVDVTIQATLLDNYYVSRLEPLVTHTSERFDLQPAG
eukprot:jgi/Tetstr1/454958/TSEL_041819.t1